MKLVPGGQIRELKTTDMLYVWVSLSCSATNAQNLKCLFLCVKVLKKKKYRHFC